MVRTTLEYKARNCSFPVPYTNRKNNISISELISCKTYNPLLEES